MPSTAFIRAKEIGREFEQAMVPVLQDLGMRVIDVDHWKYNQKKGRDVIVEVQGHRNSIEFKFDKMSEKTNQVCIDLDSINKTESAIWIFGLPYASKIDCYATKISGLAPYTYQYAKMNPGAVKRVGEWKAECVDPEMDIRKIAFH